MALSLGFLIEWEPEEGRREGTGHPALDPVFSDATTRKSIEEN